MASKGTKGKKGTQRKLTAILSADVVGYSRLMGADEEATVATLGAYRKVFTSEIKKHRGRVVDAKGDAILAEFTSVVDAVSSAVDIQKQLAERNTELSDDRRMDFRIGVNLGDVIVKDDVNYEDGDNSVTRLVALAEPGGICISRTVYDDVRSQLNLPYDTKRDSRQTAFLCQEIRQKWDTLNLLELSAVKISAVELVGRTRKSALAVYPLNEGNGLLHKIKVFLDKNFFSVVNQNRRQ